MSKDGYVPLIGLTDNCAGGRLDMRREYSYAIYKCGGAPVMIPYSTDEESLARVVARLDGVLFTGGGDMDSSYWGEEPVAEAGPANPERDEYEYALMKVCIAKKKPMFGICRGMQILNVYFGGTLYQDLPSQLGAEFGKHQHKEEEPAHKVLLEKGSLIAAMAGSEEIDANSHHHQAVKEVGKGLHVSGKSDDGLVEAFECAEPDVVAVQYHPERMVDSDEPSRRLIEAWIEKLKK